MTIQMLQFFGAKVEVSENTWKVSPCKLIGQDLIIEPDLSNAAPFMAAAMICGGTVLIKDWPEKQLSLVINFEVFSPAWEQKLLMIKLA